MRKLFKIFFIVIALAFHTFLAAVVNYVSPHYQLANITGVDVKRVDKDGPITKANPQDGPTRDVYYVFTKEAGNDKVMVYRNEETRWGFPFYFKFGSADVQAKASDYANSGKLVELKFYGWRLVMFDEFPNIISIKEVDANSTASLPIFRWVLYALLLISFFLSIQFIRGWFDSEGSATAD